MIFIWGTKSREEDGGVVGDWCEGCRAPNFHRLTNYFKVSHVYYIPLGKGQYVGTNRRCTQCGTLAACTPTTYSHALTHSQAMGLSIEQVLEATNPPLMQQLHKQRAMEYNIAQRLAQPGFAPALAPGAMPPASPAALTPARQADQRMLSALQALGTLDARNQDVSQFLDRLQKWDYLTVPESEVLLHEINAFVTEDRNVKNALQLMRMLPTPVPKWIGSLIWITGLFIFVLGFAALPFLQSLIGGGVFLALTIAICVFASKKATYKAVCGWVEKTLVPRLQQSDVEAGYFMGLLTAIKGSGRGQADKIGVMTRNSDLIAGELHRHGLLAREEEAQPALLTAPLQQ